MRYRERWKLLLHRVRYCPRPTACEQRYHQNVKYVPIPVGIYFLYQPAYSVQTPPDSVYPVQLTHLYTDIKITYLVRIDTTTFLVI